MAPGKKAPGQEKNAPAKEKNAPGKEKIINDCIHGTIVLPPAIRVIVDTPQFQRLRKIKQTGNCHLVYPNATHNRFQHSLGVGHLAQKFAQELQKRHPQWVDDKDVLCVMMAGVCHDLGHGPFSHLWESFIKEEQINTNSQHEALSLAMFEHLIESNNLKETLKEMADIDETDLLFVKEQIVGPICEKTNQPADSKLSAGSPWPYRGRTESKSFLYEIVNNQETGIDVDKWDNLLRDDYYFGIGHAFNHERFITYSKVLEVNNGGLRRKIVLRDKEEGSLYEMCRDRARLHLNGYQHRVCKIADRMLKDAWHIAAQYLKIKGRDNQEHDWVSASLKMDMVAYQKLTDEYLYFKIMESDLEELKPAQEILHRLDKRDFYKDLLEINCKDYPSLATQSDDAVLKMLQRCPGSSQANPNTPLDWDQIKIIKKVVTTGTKYEKVVVYTRPGRIVQSKINSQVKDLEQQIFFICTQDAAHEEDVYELAKDWLNSLPRPHGSSASEDMDPEGYEVPTKRSRRT